MKVDLKGIVVHRCARCDSRSLIQRHHKGCERMWLRHFKRKGRSKRFQAFRDRYFEFREEDIVPLCSKCHEALHVIYAAEISKWVRKKLFVPCKAWSWVEAEKLMAHLRKVCDRFLQDVAR